MIEWELMKSTKCLCLALMTKLMNLIIELMRELLVLRLNDYNLINMCQNLF